MRPPLDLQEFIRQLEASNDLKRVTCVVDPYLEVAAVIDQVCKTSGGGRALLFENVKGSSIPLAANLFGSMKRMAQSFGVENVDVLVSKIDDELKSYKGVPAAEAFRKIVQKPSTLSSLKPAQRQHHNRIESRITYLPALHSWPNDGGRYLTLAQVFTKLPGSDGQNCGMYRVQIVDDNRLLLRCHPGSGGDKHITAWRECSEPMPVVLALGGPPALTWAAGVSLPEDVEESAFASWLIGNEIPMSHCRFSDLKAPETADVVIEGKVFKGEELPEGPFGNHTGLYSERTPAPVIRVESVTMKNDPIYSCTVVGPPPMENVQLALATEKILLPLVKHDCPWVEDIHFPVESIYHRIAFVRLRSDCHLDVSEMTVLLKNTLLLKKAKCLVFVDDYADISNLSNIYWNIVNMGDLSLTEGVIDARTPRGKARVVQQNSVVKLVSGRWNEYDL